jgi:hypothetical protein
VFEGEFKMQQYLQEAAMVLQELQSDRRWGGGGRGRGRQHLRTDQYHVPLIFRMYSLINSQVICDAVNNEVF